MSCTIKHLIAHLEKNFVKNWDCSPLEFDVGVENLENENPKYLFSLISAKRLLCSTLNIHTMPLLITKQSFFKNHFFSINHN